MKRRWWGLALVLIVLLGLFFGLRYARSQARTKRDAAAIAYSRVRVTNGPLSILVDATGTVVSDSAADIVPSRDGQVTAVLVKPGDLVKAGQVLVRMDAADAQARLRQAEDALTVAQARLRAAKETFSLSPAQAQMELERARAGVANAKAKLDVLKAGPTEEDVAQAEAAVNQAQLAYDSAKADYERMKRLYEAQAVTKQQVDNALHTLQVNTESLNSAKAKLRQVKEPAKPEEVAAAEAALAQARADQAIAEANLRTAGQSDLVPSAEAEVRKAQDNLITARKEAEGMVLTAPFAGVVTQVTARVGTTYVGTRSQDPLVSIAAPGNLVAEVEVNENDIIQVKVGQEAAITLDAVPDQTFRGTVLTVGGLGHALDGVISFTVRVSVIDPSPEVKPGMSADASIIVVNRPSTLSVPNSAIETRMGRTVVRVYQAGGKIGYRKVATGLRTETATEILEGLRAGETVAVPAVQAETNGGQNGQAQTQERRPGVPGGGMMFRMR